MIDRYSRQPLVDLFSEQNRYESMLLVEKAAVFAFMKQNLIPKEDYELIEKNAKFNLARLHEIENVTKHDVIAFTRCVSESLGDEKKWIHYGLTSTDVVDTAQGLILKQASEIIISDLENILDVLKEKALKYKYTPCIGRTHGVHAEVTSFGLKWARWYAEMNRNLIRFKRAAKGICVGKISGAVGNFANTPSIIEEIICDKLGIGVCEISTQVLPRDLHIEYLNVLAMIATTLEEIAIEVRSLSRTEIHEVEENFTPGQKGSSAMPHKRNPIASENICGCARVVRSYTTVGYENNALWHERDISHSSAERIVLADSVTLTDYMLNRYTKVLKNLVVYENRMYDNIFITKGVIFSGRIVSLLITKGLSRESSYDLVQPICMNAYDEGIQFKDLLLESDALKYLTKEEIESCFTMDYYMKEVSTIYKRLGMEESHD